MHKQRQHWQRRDAAARRIQRAFRGWRARRRVVHRVREDMELLVADIRHQLDGEWALLGPATATLPSFTLDWGSDDKLRLPRMEDALFGVSVRFPPELEEEQRDDVAGGECEDEQVASQDSEQEPTDCPPSPDKVAVNLPLESILDSASESRPPADESTAADEVVDAQRTNAEDTSRCDARVSAVEIRGTALQAETSALEVEHEAEGMDGALLQGGKDGDVQLASVQEILASHSRADILLELEWARQALRDRRKVRVVLLLLDLPLILVTCVPFAAQSVIINGSSTIPAYMYVA